MNWFRSIPGLLCLSLCGVSLISTQAWAAPGDHARKQDTYLAIRGGAIHLQQAKERLENAKDVFGGHKKKTLEQLDNALDQLDEAVRFADKNPKAGEKYEPRFNTRDGHLALNQNKFPAIKNGAEQLREARTALDQGFNKFGGHRINALKAVNIALAELDAAYEFAK